MKNGDRIARIGVVNLMPNKEQTEAQYGALFAGASSEVELVYIRQVSHVSKHTSETYLAERYLTIEEAKATRLDGVIVTGAPIEHLPFEAVTYWQELCDLFEVLAARRVPTLFICWASQAALYHFYGVEKRPLADKMFGIFAHHSLYEDRLLEGEVAPIWAPHSRHTYNCARDIAAVPALKVLLASETAGVFLVKDQQLPFYYISGHMEYDLEALDREYWRDVRKGLAIQLPKAYYVHNDPAQGIEDTWRASAARIADRWLKYALSDYETN